MFGIGEAKQSFHGNSNAGSFTRLHTTARILLKFVLQRYAFQNTFDVKL